MRVIRKDLVLYDKEIFQNGFILTLVELGESLGQPCTALLEGKERESERSYLGFGEGWIISGQKSQEEPAAQERAVREETDPLECIRSFMQEFKKSLKFISVDDGEPVDGEAVEREATDEDTFDGEVTDRETADGESVLESGLIGYLDYEWGLVWQRPASSKANPDYFFRVCPVNIIILPEPGRVVLEVFAEEREEALSQFKIWLERLEYLFKNYQSTEFQLRETGENFTVIENRELSETGLPQARLNILPDGKWGSNIPREKFLTSVEQIQEYIKAGDIFQAVFSQKFSRYVHLSPWAFYQKLRVLNPSPYLFCIKGKDETLVGSSPELLVSTVGSRVRTRPIAGTRPRGDTESKDRANEEELRRDPKENAEHAMLVDLGRNDIGRVARYGSVEVTQYSEVERFSHVMHLVSTVEGELQPSKDGLSALQAVFPAGTLSGAPKVRAMEILQELELEPRGAYGGALGIVRWNGDVDFCITIRTLRVSKNKVSVQAGAGIVFDSVPEREYEETLYKAKALMKVVDECVDHN